MNNINMPRTSRKKKCVSIVSEKVCGPRKSCKFPKVYSRQQLKGKIKRELSRDDRKGYRRWPKDRMCVELNLTRPEVSSLYRIIQGRICGPDKNEYNPKAWTRKELIGFVKKNGIMSQAQARALDKYDLCDKVADASRKIRSEKPAEIVLPDVIEQKFLEFVKYRGNENFIPYFMYGLMYRHENISFYLRYNAWACIKYDCISKVEIKPDLVPQMKRCKTRFFCGLVAVSLGTGIHANMILYDTKKRIIWYYEPLRGGLYHECEFPYLFDFLESYFKVYLGKDIQFTRSYNYCPKANVSRVFYKQKIKGFITKEAWQHQGLCVIMNLFTMDVQLSYPDKPLNELIPAIVDKLREEEYGMLSYFHNYIQYYIDNYKSYVLEEAKEIGENPKEYVYKELERMTRERNSIEPK